MADNFRISTHSNSENMHVQLIGDFDGISAYEVLDVLEDCKNAHRIFIHTNKLRRIHPFGCDIFQKNLKHLNRPPTQIVYTGYHAHVISPQ